MNETTQENPTVSKMREVFDASIDAVLKGTELQKTVTELSASVLALKGEIGSLQRDLEYIRNRNRELDEQVSQVRAARDQALADNVRIADKLAMAESERDTAQRDNQELTQRSSALYDRIDALKKERDDAQMAQMEMEDRLKAAQGKLAEIQASMAKVFGASVSVEVDKQVTISPKPHYVDQPRDEVGKFQPTTYDRGSQSEGEGF